ncbi:LADA_0E00540g1_1 [Lachancea dasiensis]|uniref:LADA_0E00540g1_1 n=1 Tax=Lachancea dasiensis TaxID=1072105 RepID=A0A1G4JAK0_9SACH|nr:LADA_0E00540g1_1 [Lachancea dasiensis]
MSTTVPYGKFAEQLYRDLHALSTEAKRRNAEIKVASDKSQEILRIVKGFDDLARHPDFVAPFVLSCSSRNAKLTTISMQCFQKLATVNCIPDQKIEDVLNAFIESAHLAVEIQLKVLQVIPIFFKTYSTVVTGKLCSKILKCCSILLRQPNKTPMVVGTASATLQQLINDILERAIKPEVNQTLSVATGNTESMMVGPFRHDANRLFYDLCSLKGTSINHTNVLLNIESIPEDYGLEILESVLSNHHILLCECADLQFILRTKAVPLFLRSISSSRNFSIVIRSARCLLMLVRPEFLKVLELELEIIIFLLINIVSNDIESPLWKKLVALELFQLLCKNFSLLLGLFKFYDMLPDRKDILSNLLKSFQNLLASRENQSYLNISLTLDKGDTPLISQESSSAKVPLIELFDKPNPPLVDQTYSVYLILSIVNQISEGIGAYAVALNQKEIGQKETDIFKTLYNTLFPDLFSLHKSFLYSTTLDTPLFHSTIRALQKLSHASGILELSDTLENCLNLFGVATVEACTPTSAVKSTTASDQNLSTATAMLNTISGSLIGHAQNAAGSSEALLPQAYSIHPRTISVFRALVSLSVSLGPSFNAQHWDSFLKTWQWMSFFLSEQSNDFEDSRSILNNSQSSQVTSSDINAAKTSIVKFCESTQNYSNTGFIILVQAIIKESTNCALQKKKNGDVEGQLPTSSDGKILNCAYNEDFFLVQLGELSRLNMSRLLKEKKDVSSWDLIIGHLIQEASSRIYDNETLRLCSVDTLNNVVAQAALESSELEPSSSLTPEMVEQKLLTTLVKLIEKILRLERNREAVHNGFIETECDIIFQALRTLKGLLDVFGDSMQTTWGMVFRIINSPFEMIHENAALESSILEEDSSILDLISAKHKGMIQVSFDVFKLIFDDFLQTLPLSSLKSVIDTLLNFVRQERDLNISFSSISQFWLIGDYLRTSISKGKEQFSASQRSEFVASVENGNLARLIMAYGDETREMYYALWLYLLKKLVECTADERIEVKNGAIQTFFRIVDSHSSSFPPWELVIHEVLAPLLLQGGSSDQYLKSVEFINLTLKGLIQLFSLYFSDFSIIPNLESAWELLVRYVAKLLQIPSFELSFVVLKNLRCLLEAMLPVEALPDTIVLELYETWSSYNMVYSDSLKSEFKGKTNFECIGELLTCYPFLHQLLNSRNLLDCQKVETIFNVMNCAARYPLLPEFSSDNQKPSTLQKTVLDSVKVFELQQPLQVELLILTQISTIVALPFETRARIENKLGPRLSSTARKRIPSFEAISYEFCEYLAKRLESFAEVDEQFVNSKRLLKLLKNLSVPIVSKSLIGGSKGTSETLWVRSSRCFRLLCQKVLTFLNNRKAESAVPEDVRDSFYSIFVEVAVTPLKRVSTDIDSATEANDMEEFACYKDILLKSLGPKFPTNKQLEIFVSAVWAGSFFHEVDEIEDAIIKSTDSLDEVAVKLAEFPFDDVLGSTADQISLSKYRAASMCLRTLMEFTIFDEAGYDRLQPICVPFMVSRYAFIMRRYISDVELLNRKPVPKGMKLEMLLVLNGLNQVLKCVCAKGKDSFDSQTVATLQILYPLVLRAIPASHKIPGLQTIVQELSLNFTRLPT